MKCRNCKTELTNIFVDLGSSPPSNSYLTEQTLNEPEKCYPLRVMVCDQCWLVQTEDFVRSSDIFSEDYAYFSSFSSSWLKHARNYVTKMISRFNLTLESRVVEIAANDGYLLQYVKEAGIPCFGIEPTHSTAEAAREKGIEIIEAFFNVKQAEGLVRQKRQADLIVGNNVLAHVPDINDFVKAVSILLKSNGMTTFEFPHLLNLIDKNQFDTIYHEHYSYLSFIAVQKIFEENGLTIFDIEALPTHGGSLRVYAQRSDTGQHSIKETTVKFIKQEVDAGMNVISFYQGFQGKVEKIKNDLLNFLLDAKKQGKLVVAYGAAAKGNTLINFANIDSELVSYVVDKNPIKQNKYMPGSRIAIVDEERLRTDKPDYVILLPWNLEHELMEQLNYIKSWGGKFVKAIPSVMTV